MKHLARDLALFAIIALIFCLGRLAIIIIFGADYEMDISLKWITTTLRFDAQAAMFAAIPILMLTSLVLIIGDKRPLEISKQIYATVAITLSAACVIANIGFFSEYRCQFNDWIFGIVQDDTKAILGVIWKDYPIIWLSITLIMLSYGTWMLFKLIYKKTENLRTPDKIHVKMLYILASIVMAVFVIRGSSWRGHPLNDMDTVVVKSTFLNNLTPTPAFCIKREISGALKASSGKSLKDIDLKNRDLAKGVAEIWPPQDQTPVHNLDAFLERKTTGSSFKPDQIFLIIGESHSSYPFFNEKYRHLMPETLRLSQNALYTFKCLSAARKTMASVGSIVSGLPFAGTELPFVQNLTLNYQIIDQLKQLGYKTNFYYSGPLAWHNIGTYMARCGIENQVSCEKITGEGRTSFWGAKDHELVDYILRNPPPPQSFNIILTVSNHPPFDIDVSQFGYPHPINTETDNQIAHAWYADHFMGKLVDGLRAQSPNSLFIITGDHPSRMRLDDRSLERHNYVPLLFLGKPIEEAGLAGELDIATHLDIPATLLELVAPEGITYHSWGRNLIQSPKSSRPEMNPFVLYKDGILYEKEGWDTPQEFRRLINLYQGLSRWRTFNGTDLP